MKQRMSKVWSFALALLLAAQVTLPYAHADFYVETGVSTALTFEDVSPQDYFYEAVSWAQSQRFVTGTSALEFTPDATVTRAEAVTMLWRAAGSPQPNLPASPFTDVTDPSAYYYEAVLWAVEAGVTNGVSSTRFGVGEKLSYDQIFTFLHRATEGPVGSDWSREAMTWAIDSGITDRGYGDAKAGCPRADLVYSMWKHMKLLKEQGSQTPEEPEEEEDVLQPQPGDDTQDMVLGNKEMLAADLINALLERAESIDVSKYRLTRDEFIALYQEITDVNGENPYGIAYDNIISQMFDKVTTVKVRYVGDPVTDVTEQTTAKAAEIVAQYVTPSMSDYEIAKVLHDYLVLNCAYDMRYYSGNMPQISYTANGALLEETAVCAGYAKAYQLLLRTAGVPCEYVTGYARGYHAWNIVQIDGAWYHVDATWDDPTPNREGYVRYDYFLLSDSALGRDHNNWEAPYRCTSTRYDNQNLPDRSEQENQQKPGGGTQTPAQDELQDLIKFCLSAVDSFPAKSEDDRKKLSINELKNCQFGYIYFHSKSYSPEFLQAQLPAVAAAVAEQFPLIQVERYDPAQNLYRVVRNDILAEIALKEQQAQDTDARIQAKVDELAGKVQETLCTMNVHRTRIDTSMYSYEVVRRACEQLNTPAYTFTDGEGTVWRGEEDFVVGQYSGELGITNHRWFNARLQPYYDQLEQAIARRQTEILLPPDLLHESPNNSPSWYALYATGQVSQEGYEIGGLISGQDFKVTYTTIRSETDEYEVRIAYMD